MAGITVSRPSLTVKSLGDPKKVLGMDGDKARHLIGTIFGTANGVATKVITDKVGNTQTFEPIKGNFEGIPSVPQTEKGDDGKEVEITGIRSGTLYLPSGIHDQIAEALKAPDAQPIKFAIEVYTIKAANAAGYTYEARAVLETTIADPLTEMRAALVGKTKLLPGPKAAPEEKKRA